MDFLDELHRTVSLSDYPQRIVSLVPSVTETLFELGAGARIVGVTSFCTHPPGDIVRIEKVGGTKDPQLASIVHLAPDVVILNEEENRHEDFTWLEEHGLCVYVTAPRTVADGIKMIENLSDLVGCQEAGQAMAQPLRAQATRLASASEGQTRLRIFCPIWRKPWMSFNVETYIDDMLWLCGGENIFRAKPERYCTVTLDEVRAADPHIVLLPSEPYPFAPKHFVYLKPLSATYAGKMGHLYCVDGMALCWYGPRIADGFAELNRVFSYVREALDE